MSELAWQLTAVGLYFVAMIVIGYYAYKQTTDVDDYMLAGRQLHPGVAGLSAGTSDMSGWLLMGLPGAIYVTGLFEAWMAIGLTIGAWINWRLIAPRLRSFTEVSNNSITLPSFLENRLQTESRALRVVTGLVILIFFTFYVSSGMVAGGVFFEQSFGTSYTFGMLLVAGVTLAYTLYGGFLGATLTDVAQGLLMIGALILVPIIALFYLGGPGEMFSLISEADEARSAGGEAVNRTSLFYGGTFIAGLSAAAWGLGYFGQPHIIVRFMALRSAKDAKIACRVGMGWMIIVLICAVLTGLIGVAYYYQQGEEIGDPEAVFLLMSQVFFHPFVAGVVLAAVLAAIMSTVSSQLVVCSSALVEDLYKMLGKDSDPKREMILGRWAVLAVAIIAGVIAFAPDSNILDLVGFAWGGFGASLGPIIVLALFWRKLTAAGALTGMILGTVTVFIWANIDAVNDLYEIVPGFIIGIVSAWLVSLATQSSLKTDKIDAEFEKVKSDI